MRILSAFAIGLIFGLGIVISDMINPAKVLNFFDFAGSWDPSLAFVMGGALLVTAIGYQAVILRDGPIFAPHFNIPSARQVDMPLIAGSAVFGVGWGVSGFCPGGLVPALGVGRAEPFIFLAGLFAGLIGTRFWRAWIYRHQTASA